LGVSLELLLRHGDDEAIDVRHGMIFPFSASLRGTQ
jgi:hypothetical protein